VTVSRTDTLTAEAHALMGGVYISTGEDPRRAAQAFEAAARRAPTDARVAQWYASAATARERASDPEGALLDLGHLVSLGGLFAVDGWTGIGRIRFELGDLAGAYDAYQNGLLETPDPRRARLVRLGMAHALERLGEADAAVAELEEFADGEDLAFEMARGRMIARVEARRSDTE
jgi:cytochrome c-type biogenesis protein CcmH/NrfG